jgi:Tol biopolymer transport system component/DNA-binding winged helix-turn-helix (wHTH) protein
MAEAERQLRLLRFDDFEVDPRSGELRKAGVKLKFGGQPFQVLSVLLERPGEVVTREELQKRLWPDTFVDVDHNLNTAINKIREVLGDSAESPRYVETLPRRGYRFIGEVEPPVERVVPVVPDRGSHSRRWSGIAAGIVAISVLAFGAFVAYRSSRQQRPAEKTAVLTAFPFTSLPGEESAPAFSPDGSRISFNWNGDPASGAKGFDLYMKAIGSETLIRLTHHPSEWVSSAWSPDGTQIAFHRLAGADTGIYLVPALGGPERKLRSTRIPWNLSTPISWSPDGKWIAFADLLPTEEHARIYLLSMETLETKEIPNDPKCLGQIQPAFSPSGKYLAYWCNRSQDEAVLYSLPLAGGKAQTVISFLGFPAGLAWSADDKELIYSLDDWFTSKLTEVTVANGSVKRLAFTGNAGLPAVSSSGDKLAFDSYSGSANIWRRDLLHSEVPAVELIPSTRLQYNPEYSPDGKHVAFSSERTGVPGVWISSDDGSNLMLISTPHVVSGSPQWSPDGKKIAFDSRPQDLWEIYVADVAEGNPRKLVTNISSVYRPHWSRDGRWIYFRSYETGRAGIYRCPAAGGDAIALSKDIDGYGPQESFDGKTVYFANRDAHSKLRKVDLSAQPGTESEVEGFPRLSGSQNWTLTRSGIYFVPDENPKSVRYFDFVSKQIHQIFAEERELGRGLSISPDGRWILYSQGGYINSDIMLVEHFH